MQMDGILRPPQVEKYQNSVSRRGEKAPRLLQLWSTESVHMLLSRVREALAQQPGRGKEGREGSNQIAGKRNSNCMIGLAFR